MAMAALAAGLSFGTVANAAGVDVFLTKTAPDSWDLTATVNAGPNLGALNLIVTGLDVLTVNALNTGVSAADSSMTVDGIEPGRNFMIVQNTATNVAIASLGGGNTLLATLSGPTGGLVSLVDTSEFGGADNGVFAASGAAIFDYSITVQPLVPEPAVVLLLGLGLAGLGLVRRSA
jgi:hypothetical protein